MLGRTQTEIYVLVPIPELRIEAAQPFKNRARDKPTGASNGLNIAADIRRGKIRRLVGVEVDRTTVIIECHTGVVDCACFRIKVAVADDPDP
ncbi:MAG: hypothetical protein WAM77_00805 [Xanthobacteraceae bacterium]